MTNGIAMQGIIEYTDIELDSYHDRTNVAIMSGLASVGFIVTGCVLSVVMHGILNRLGIADRDATRMYGELVAAQWGLATIWACATVGLVASAPLLRFRASKDGVLIQYGLTKLIQVRIPRKEINKISALPQSAFQYSGKLGFIAPGTRFARFSKLAIWTCIVASYQGGALAIEATKGKFLVSCLNPTEVVDALRTEYALDNSAIEAPALWRDRLTWKG